MTALESNTAKSLRHIGTDMEKSVTRTVTGKKLPPDAKTWKEVLHEPRGTDLAQNAASKRTGLGWIQGVYESVSK